MASGPWPLSVLLGEDDARNDASETVTSRADLTLGNANLAPACFGLDDGVHFTNNIGSLMLPLVCEGPETLSNNP